MTKKVKDKALQNTKLSGTEKEQLIKKTDKSSPRGKRRENPFFTPRHQAGKSFKQEWLEVQIVQRS